MKSFSKEEAFLQIMIILVCSNMPSLNFGIVFLLTTFHGVLLDLKMLNLFSFNGKEQLEHSAEHHLFCSTEESKWYRLMIGE